MALVAIVALGGWLKPREERSEAVGPTEGPAQVLPVGDPTPDPSSSPAPAPVDPGSTRVLGAGTHSVTVAGTPFSFRVPGGWELYEDLHITKNTVGPQGAEAIIYWTSIAEGPAGPCGQWWGAPPGSAVNFAASASGAKGVGLISGPLDAVVGGLPASHVVFEVRGEAAACQPGFFYTWRERSVGAFWPGVDVGDTIRIWILDVDGTRLYIEAATKRGASPDLVREIHQIIGSVRFG